MKAFPDSLSARLLLAYLGAWLVTAALAAVTVASFLRADPARWADHSTLEFARALAREVVFDARGVPVALPWPDQARWVAEALPTDLGWRVIDASGRVLMSSAANRNAAWPAPASAPQAGPARVSVEGVDLRLRTVPLEPAATPLWLQVGMSERLITLLHGQSAARLGGTFVAAAVISVLLLAVALFIVLRQLLRPVRQVSQEALALGPGRPGVRLRGQTLPRELRPLVDAFNASLQAQEEAHARQIGFLADAAHELKTPLALVRAQLELGDTDPQVLLRDVDQLSRQVRQWLVLAEVAEPRSYRPEALSVADVATDVCEKLDPLAARHHVNLSLDVAIAPRIDGDRSALAVLLKNLVENAIEFTPAGKAVAVTTDDRSLRVRDEGPGIDAAHLPRLFDRFWRAPQRRDSGAGLGLAICREIASAQGWGLQARNVAGGAEFEVVFRVDEPLRMASQ